MKIDRKLKIGVVIDQLLPGGVQKAAIEEVRWLNKAGQSAKLVILMRKGFERKFSKLIIRVPYEFLSDRYPPIFRKSFKLPFFTFLSTLHLASPILAPFAVKKNEFDLIVSHGTTTSLTTWSLSKFCKIPYFAVVHDPMVYILDKVYSKTPLRYLFPILKPLATFLEAQFTNSAKLCLVDSFVHAGYLNKKYRVDPTVLYLGINPPKKIAKKRGDAILAFGRWDMGKNPQMLLKLAKSLPKTKLVMAGAWTQKADFYQFKKQINLENLNNRVKLIPQYSEKELGQICKLGRVWVHPHFEAFSLSALEAAAHGLPIIIPAKSGVTEIFKNGVHGFFPEKPTYVNFKKVLIPLLEDERKAFNMGIAAAEVAKSYTPKRRASQLVELVERVLKTTQLEMIALETGHVTGSLVAGGDRLLEEMMKRIEEKLSLTVIIPKIAQEHWRRSGVKINLKILPGNFFERYTGPFGVFANYLVRTWQSAAILGEIIKGNKNKKILLYSSTGIWPDVIPSYIQKIFKPKIIWLARIHHLSLPPSKRPGRFWVNFGSAILEKLALFAIRTKSDLILVLNSNLKRKLENSSFPNEKLVVLGGAVDFEAISNLKGKFGKRFDGVYLGRIHPAKGIFDLAPIWQNVVRSMPNAKLAVIGTGPAEITANLSEQIKKFNLEKNIHLLGFLPQKKVWGTLKSAKVFLFTDHEAGFGLAAAEALAAGCPVVGWDIGVLGSVFKSGFWVVPQNNHHLFAEKICLLLGNQRLHQKLSKLATAEAAKFDWEKISLKFQNILDQISN